MNSNGLPTPESTPGPDAGRLAADKARQDGANGQPVATNSALPTVPEDQEQNSAHPPGQASIPVQSTSEQVSTQSKPSSDPGQALVPSNSTSKQVSTQSKPSSDPGQALVPSNSTSEQVSTQSKPSFDQETVDSEPSPGQALIPSNPPYQQPSVQSEQPQEQAVADPPQGGQNPKLLGLPAKDVLSKKSKSSKAPKGSEAFKESKVSKASKATKASKVSKRTGNGNDDVEMTSGTYTAEQREVVNRVLEAFNKAEYYKVLGITSDSSPEQVKAAYKATARTVHPDKNEDAEANQLFQHVLEAYSVLKDDGERSKWSKDPTSYKPSEYQAADASTYGESFHHTAFDNTILYFDAHLERAGPHVKKLLSEPNDAQAVEELKAINDEMEKMLDECDDIREIDEVKIDYDTIKSFVIYAQTIAGSPVQEDTIQRLQGINKDFKFFLDTREYPEDWYKDLPVGFMKENHVVPVVTKKENHVKPVVTKKENHVKPVVTKGDYYVSTKSGDRILGYSKVGRGHQFIVEIKDGNQPTYELKSGSEIGFKTVEEYLDLPEEDKNHLGASDHKYDRQDAKRYQGIYGVASKPLQTATIGGRTRLPTAWVLTGFGDASTSEKVWLTRTTVRKICGKASADEDIRQWYLEAGLTPVDEIPPKVEKRKLGTPSDNTPAGTESIKSLTGKLEILTNLVLAMQSQQAQQQQGPPQEKTTGKTPPSK